MPRVRPVPGAARAGYGPGIDSSESIRRGTARALPKRAGPGDRGGPGPGARRAPGRRHGPGPGAGAPAGPQRLSECMGLESLVTGAGRLRRRGTTRDE